MDYFYQLSKGLSKSIFDGWSELHAFAMKQFMWINL